MSLYYNTIIPAACIDASDILTTPRTPHETLCKYAVLRNRPCDEMTFDPIKTRCSQPHHDSPKQPHTACHTSVPNHAASKKHTPSVAIRYSMRTPAAPENPKPPAARLTVDLVHA